MPVFVQRPGCFLRAVLFSSSIAVSLLAQEPSASLKKADADYRAGVAALSRNDLKAARADFEEVVHLAPEAEQGHSALGAVMVRLGQQAEGIGELQKALAMKPTDTSAQMNLALAYEQTGASARALPLFEKLERATRGEKRSLPAYVMAAYARALAANGQRAASIAKMKEAIDGDPENPELRDELGSLYAQGQDWQNAGQQFAEAIRLRPDFAAAHLHLGFVLQAEQQSDAASEWMRAYQLAPDDAAIAFAAGKALAEAGQDEQAVPILEHALKNDPTSSAAAYQLGLALQRLNRPEDAVPLLKKAVAADPSSADALTNLGMALCQAQRAKEAVPVLRRAVSLKPDNATAHQDLAAAYIQLSQLADAVSELRAALKLSPESPQLHYNLGLAFKMQDDAANAIPELQTAERLNPSASEPPYALGLLYMQVGRYSEAAAELELSLKLRPENGEAWSTLGSVYNKLGRLPEATNALREATKQLPNQPDPHLLLAEVLVKQNLTADAAAERKQAAQLMLANMNRQRAEVATNSGKSLLSNGKTEDAIVQFRDALAFDPKYTEAHLELATALEKEGKMADAAAERQQARSLESGP